jgi:hypothetical protein
MPMLIISGPAQAFAKDPRGSKPITDRISLVRFHGLVSAEACADIFGEERGLIDLGLSGGQIGSSAHLAHNSDQGPRESPVWFHWCCLG